MGKVVYKVVNRCPRGLPKVHSGRKWIELIQAKDTAPFIEGVIIVDGCLSVLKYAGSRKVIAQPLDTLPDLAFEAGLSDDCKALLRQYIEDYKAGTYNLALQEHQQRVSMF